MSPHVAPSCSPEHSGDTQTQTPCTAHTPIPSLQAPQPCPPRMQAGPGCWRRAQHRVNYLLLHNAGAQRVSSLPLPWISPLPPRPVPAPPAPAHWCPWLYFSARDQLFPCQTFMFLFNSLSASQISTDRLLQCLPWKKMRCHKLFLIQVNKISPLFLTQSSLMLVANFRAQREAQGHWLGPSTGDTVGSLPCHFCKASKGPALLQRASCDPEPQNSPKL